MKTTIVTFKALTHDRRVVHKDVPIHHDFEEIPPIEFNGIMLPKTSVEHQVMEFLDNTDKSDLMERYGFYIILDYHVKKPREKKEDRIKREMDEFIESLKVVFELCPHLETPFLSIISESKDILFGKGKSNKQKLYEVMKMYDMIMLGVNGLLDSLLKKTKKENKKLLE